MRKPDAWMDGKGQVKMAATVDHYESLREAYCVPLFALTDEEREAMRTAIRAMECMEYDAKHIAALEGLLGKPAPEGQDG